MAVHPLARRPLPKFRAKLRVQKKSQLPQLPIRMAKELTDAEVLYHVKVHLAWYDLWQWRERVK
jgi:hypothetical protein